jgi:hypothetical protein
VTQPQIFGIIAGLVLASVYIILHLVDERRKQKQPKPGGVQMPFSPVAMVGRLTFIGVLAWVVIRYTDVDKLWFIGTFAAVYGIFFFWELKRQWSFK